MEDVNDTGYDEKRCAEEWYEYTTELEYPQHEVPSRQKLTLEEIFDKIKNIRGE
jgi:hypothetical protein